MITQEGIDLYRHMLSLYPSFRISNEEAAELITVAERGIKVCHQVLEDCVYHLECGGGPWTNCCPHCGGRVEVE